MHPPALLPPSSGRPVSRFGNACLQAGLRTIKAAWEDRLLEMSSALAFTTILAIVPLLAVTLALMTAFPFFSDFEQALQTFLRSQLMPEAFSETVMRYLDEFVNGASRLSAIGAVFLVVTSIMVIMSIDDALNDIWHVRKRRSIGQRILIYWAVLTLGPLLLGGTLWASAFVARQALALPGSETLHVSALVLWLPYLISCFGFSLLFITVPNRKVRLIHALTGAIVTASLFELIKWALGIYFALIPTYTLIYGAFSVLPAFLLWVYFSWMAVLVGALVAANLPEDVFGKRHESSVQSRQHEMDHSTSDVDVRNSQVQ